ncbi:MAG: hypothetical protein LBB11_00430 [Puniceicoccales bacterium]|nr:hypothetical protein [Puniceicoccales bacterium]
MIPIIGVIAVETGQFVYGKSHQEKDVTTSKPQFQRDLSSFPVHQFMSDDEAIAIDAKIALAMGVAAAGVQKSIFATLLGSKIDLIVRYNKFVSTIEQFIRETDPLEFEVFETLNTILDLFLRQNGSIGSLSGSSKNFRQINVPNTLKLPRRKPEMTNEEWKKTLADYRKLCVDFVKQNKEQLAKNFKASWDVIDKNFREVKVHPILQDIRAIQFVPELDVYALRNVRDLSDSGSNQTVRNQAGALFKRLSRDAIVGNAKILDLARQLIDSTFFVDFKLKPIDDAICNVIGEVLTQDLSGLPLNEDEKETIISAMKAKLAALRKASFGDEDAGLSGIRGRTAAHVKKEQARFYSNREKPIQSFAACRCSDVDLLLLKKLPEASSNPEKVTAFLKAMEKDETLIQEEQTALQAADTQMLPQNRVEILNDPIKFFQDALETTAIPNARKQAIKRYISAKLELHSDMTPEVETEVKSIIDTLKNKLLSIQFIDGQKKKRTLSELTEIKGNNIASIPSFGSILRNAGLRTICGISGSAMAAMAGLWACIGKEKTKAILQPLKDFVDGDCAEPERLSDDFKRLFLSIAMYMQAGQYHSAGEVLEGLYASAIILCLDNDDLEQTKQMFPQFELMLEAFKAHPEDFFPLSNEEKSKLNKEAPNIIKALQKHHMEVVKERAKNKVKDDDRTHKSRPRRGTRRG